jgi:hypothetical protein
VSRKLQWGSRSGCKRLKQLFGQTYLILNELKLKLKPKYKTKMKKIIFTSAATIGLSVGAFAQGSLLLDDSVINPGVSVGVTSPSATTTADWYTGSISLDVYYLAGTDTSDIDAINAFNGVQNSSAAVLSLLAADQFTLETTADETVSGGVFKGGTVSLPNIPTSATGTFVILGFTGAAPGTAEAYADAIAFANSTGGNPAATPIPGTAATLAGWNTLNQNMALTLSSVPEPGTMALSALGGLSLFFFRRKK